MTALDVSCRFLNQIKNAASQCAVYGDPQALIDIISQIQKESFLEGFDHAIQVLQEGKNNELKC